LRLASTSLRMSSEKRSIFCFTLKHQAKCAWHYLAVTGSP
jgi:hypothetical protein